MSTVKNINARIVHKHAKEVDWNKASAFVPKLGELIVYEQDDMYLFPRFKVGDGVTTVSKLPFIVHNPVWSGTEAEYEVAYDAGLIPVGTIVCLLDDDTTDSNSTTAVLGYAILGQMILG